MQNGPHDLGPAPVPASGYQPAPSTNRTLLIVLAAVTSAALLVCCGGSAAAVFYFRTHAERLTAAPPEPGVPPAPTVPPTRPSAPAPPPAPLDSDRTIEGRGSKVVPVPAGSAPDRLIVMTHSGRGGFAVTGLDGAGRTVGLLGNSYGRYRGTMMLDGIKKPVSLKVVASGAWKLVIRDARKAPRWSGTGSGTSSTVLQVGADDAAVVRYGHRGKGNFVIWSFGDDGRELLVNEIGRVSGESMLPAGSRYLEIKADGAWTFART